MEKSNIVVDIVEDIIICNKCGIEIPTNQSEEHNMRCMYAFNISDFENLIPCELCQELISVEDYISHTTICSNSYRRTNLNMYNSFGADDVAGAAGAASAAGEAIEDVQSQLNNDPVVRALFNFMIGQPLPTTTPQDLNESNNTDSVDAGGVDAVGDSGAGAGGAANGGAEVDSGEVDSGGVDAGVDAGADGGVDAGVDAGDGGAANGGAEVDSGADAGVGGGVIHPINPFIEFLHNLPNQPNNIQNIESFINTIVDTNTNDQMMNYEDLANLDDIEVGINNIDQVSELQFSECYCPICCQTCLLTRKTKCGHMYCDTCLTQWLKTNKKCPTCMIELE